MEGIAWATHNAMKTEVKARALSKAVTYRKPVDNNTSHSCKICMGYLQKAKKEFVPSTATWPRCEEGSGKMHHCSTDNFSEIKHLSSEGFM